MMVGMAVALLCIAKLDLVYDSRLGDAKRRRAAAQRSQRARDEFDCRRSGRRADARRFALCLRVENASNAPRPRGLRTRSHDANLRSPPLRTATPPLAIPALSSSRTSVTTNNGNVPQAQKFEYRVNAWRDVRVNFEASLHCHATNPESQISPQHKDFSCVPLMRVSGCETK
jgi:hypothetical protein